MLSYYFIFEFASFCCQLLINRSYKINSGKVTHKQIPKIQSKTEVTDHP